MTRFLIALRAARPDLVSGLGLWAWGLIGSFPIGCFVCVPGLVRSPSTRALRLGSAALSEPSHWRLLVDWSSTRSAVTQAPAFLGHPAGVQLPTSTVATSPGGRECWRAGEVLSHRGVADLCRSSLAEGRFLRAALCGSVGTDHLEGPPLFPRGSASSLWPRPLRRLSAVVLD